jgi:hypothetical protein
MKNLLVLCAGIFVCSSITLAQLPPLYKAIDPNPQNPYQSDGADNMFFMDSSYYISYGYFNPDWVVETGIIRLDTKGDIKKSILIKEENISIGFSDGGAYHLTKDGYILFAGQSYDIKKQRQRVCLFKMTPQLQVVWTKYYGHPERDYYCTSVTETEDGRYLIYASDGYKNVNINWLRLIATDTAGTLLWDRIIPDTFAWSANGNMIPTADGNLLFSAANYREEEDHYGCQIIKTNTEGQIIWRRSFPFMRFNIEEPLSTPMPDGGSVLMWAKDTSLWIPGVAGGELPVLRRYSPDGEWLWETGWHRGYHRVLRIITAANGDIIGGGFRVPSFDTQDYAWMFRVNPEGRVLWNRFYSDSLQRPWTFMGIYDLAETAEGDIVATGRVRDTIQGGDDVNSNPFFLRTGPDGCLNRNCSDSTQFITIVKEPGRGGLFGTLPNLRVAPNPVRTTLYVTLPEGKGGERHLEWYSLSGRRLQGLALSGDEAAQKALPVDVPPVPDGLYWLVLREAGQPVAKQSIIIKK